MFLKYKTDDYSNIEWLEIPDNIDIKKAVEQFIRSKFYLYDTDNDGEDTYYVAVTFEGKTSYFSCLHTYEWDRIDDELINTYELIETNDTENLGIHRDFIDIRKYK